MQLTDWLLVVVALLLIGLAQISLTKSGFNPVSEAVRHDGRFQMQGGKNFILPKEINEKRFFWDSYWLEVCSNHLYPSMGPNGGSVAMDSGYHPWDLNQEEHTL